PVREGDGEDRARANDGDAIRSRRSDAVRQGPVYQAGTYAAHPHAMAAGVAALEHLDASAYERLEETARALADGIGSAGADGVSVVRAGTILSVAFSDRPPRSFSEAEATDRTRFSGFHRAMRDRGILLPPSPFEAWFPSLAHTDEDIARTVDAARAALAESATG
ncbi:MAG TPA: hypothetical protein VM840_02765, partial [Actinomycetota bacterium]|nr:hypothetical protein [Actinomycetota bacterium]